MKEHRNRTGRLAAAVLLILTLAGCAAFERNTEPQDAFEEEDDAATYILQYQLRRYEMSQGGQSVFFQEEDGKGFLALVSHKTGEEIPEEKLEDPDFVNDGRYAIYENDLYHFSEKGKRTLLRDYQPIPDPEEPDGVESYRSEVHPKAFRNGENGKILCVELSYERWLDPKTTPQFHTRNCWYIRVLNERGAELSCSEIESAQNGDGMNCDSLVYLGDDLLAVSQGSRVLVFGTDGKERFSVSTPLPAYELCRIGAGKLAVLLKNDQKRWLSVVDMHERSAGVPKEIPDGAHSFCRGEAEDILYFIRNTELFRLHLDDWAVERVDSLLSIGVEPDSLASMFVREDGTLHFLLHEWDPVAERSRETYAIAEPVNETMEGIVLRLGFRSISGTLKKAVLQFNKNRSDIRIEAVDYNNSDAEFQKTGELLVMDAAEYESYLSEGRLADLEPMLQSDPDYSKEQFFPSVWRGLSTPDGNLKRMAANFRVESMACDTEAVAGRTVMSLTDLREHLREMGRGGSLYEPWYTAERLLNDLVLVNRAALGQEGSPDYDQSLYEDLKSFSNLQPLSYDYNSYTEDPSSVEKRIAEGRLLMMQAHIASLQEFKWYDAFFENGASFPGWPTKTGSFSRILFDESLGLSVSCSEKEREAAWQFIRMLLTEEYAADCYGFPVKSALMEKWLEEDAAAISYRLDKDGKVMLDDEGNRIEQARRSWYSPEWKRHYEYAITEEQSKKLLELINRSI